MSIDMPIIIITLTSAVIAETMRGPTMLDAVEKLTVIPVSYTHLTLPTSSYV